MAWNEPGGGRDPWGGGDNQQGPPDLEEALKKLQTKLFGIFGGRPRPGGGGGGGGGGGSPFGSVGTGVILVVLLAVWIVAGFFIVDPAEQAVITRFGKYERTVDEGPHWLPYFIEDYETVNVQQVRPAEIGFRSAGRSQGSVGNESLMLTQDENIIDVKFAIQYRVKDTPNYLFKVLDPDLTLRQATESAVREIVGKSSMDFVITEGRSAVAAQAKDLIQNILDKYEAGLLIISVNMQDAQPPAQVQEAFYDAVKAREDEVRSKNEAEAYANDILPKSRGDADAMREQASGYKSRVIALAEGETSRFLAVLNEYTKAPAVTRQRLYLEAMESVLANSSKIIMGVEGGNNLLYLPLDQIMSRRSEAQVSGYTTGEALGSGASAVSDGDRLRGQRESFRSGRTR